MFVLFLSFLLALGQVARADQFRFNFSTIEQCQPVSISFSGTGKANRIPTSLTLIPFNSRPVSIPLPVAAGNSTGVTVSFLPLPAGTQFIASIDDDEGDNSSKVSDVFRVLPSPNGDASCLPSGDNSSVYTLPSAVSQCESFNIPYTTDAAPTVRVFIPRGGSFELSTQDNLGGKIGTYMMNATRQASVVIMAYNDVIERGMTSSLLTVGGDASSPSDCFKEKNKDGKGRDKGKDNSNSQSGAASVSNAVAIGLGVGGGVVFLVTIALGFFLCHRRRQQRTARNLDFNPALLEKRSSFTKSDYSGQQIAPSLTYSPAVVSYSPQVVANPPYTASRFSKSTDDNYPVPTWTSPEPALNGSGSAQSPSKFDIERALNYVSEQSSDDAHRSPPISARLPTPIDTTRVLTPHGRHEARPAGVPLSAVEPLTPNADDGSPRESFASSGNFEMLSRPPVALTAASASLLMAPSAPSSRFSDPSFMGTPAIGDFPRPPFATDSNTQRDSNDSWGNLGSAR